jgi:hypothetical protein
MFSFPMKEVILLFSARVLKQVTWTQCKENQEGRTLLYKQIVGMKEGTEHFFPFHSHLFFISTKQNVHFYNKTKNDTKYEIMKLQSFNKINFIANQYFKISFAQKNILFIMFCCMWVLTASCLWKQPHLVLISQLKLYSVTQ